jgi:pimeloyl-ACP methyl ester carboxylesterase
MGKSEAPGRPEVTHTIEDHAKDFEGFLEGLGVDRAAIVGHAFGGFVAMRVAIDRPELVSAIVLVNSTAKSPSGGDAPGWARTAESEGMEPLLDNQMSRWFLERLHRDQPEVIQFYREMLGANPPMGYAANSRGVALMDLRSELNAIKCPTILIGGKEDKSIPLSVNKQNAEQIPGAQLALINDASHVVPEEQPVEFNRTALEFLDQNIPRGLIQSQ